MIIARPLSGITLAGALMVAGWDGYKVTSGHSAFAITSLRDLSVWAHLPNNWLPPPLASPHWRLENWNDVLAATLEAPAALLFACLAMAFWLMGRRRRLPQVERADEPADAETDAPAQPNLNRSSELRKALWSCSSAFLATAGFSGLLNLLMLTGSLFMLEVYDRVLPSRSVPTLIGLCLVAAILFTAQGLLDLIRGRLLVRVGSVIDESLAARVFDILVLLPVRAGNRNDSLQPLRDLDAIRSFLSGPGPTALFDLPWLPFYLGIVFAFHPLLGVTATAGAIVLIVLTLLTELLVRRPMRDTTAHTMGRLGLAEASVRNAEVLAGMGFGSRMRSLWMTSNTSALAAQRRASEELRQVWNAKTLEVAEAELKALIVRYRKDAPKLASWLETAVPEGLAVFKLPKEHRRRMRTSNPIERSIQQELKRRTQKIRVFSNEASLERLVSAILVEIDETWTASLQPYVNWNSVDAD